MMGGPPQSMMGGPPPMSQSMMGSSMYMGGNPMQSMGGGMPGTMGPSMMGMPPQTMAPGGMGGGPMMGGGAPFGPGSGQYMPNVSRPGMTAVANPPIAANNIQYGPSYKMQYAKRSTADKTAVKYTGFLPLEGVYEEDTCRIG